MIIYIAIFLVILVLAVEYNLDTFKVQYGLVPLIILLAFLAGFRSPNVSKDYEEYKRIFDFIFELKSISVSDTILPLFEPIFSLIVNFFKSTFPINYALAIMLFFAIFSVTLKLVSFNSLTTNPFLAILFYYCIYFFLHEMAQIRFGLASGIVFFGLTFFFSERKNIFILSVLIASLIHYSALSFLVIFLFQGKFNKYFFGIMLIAAVLLGFIQTPLTFLLNKIDLAFITPRVSNYIDIVEEGRAQAINVFNTINLINIAICSFFIIYIPKKQIDTDKKLSIFLKCGILSIFLLSFFASIPSVAFRISEIFSIMFIFLYVYLNQYLPFKKNNIFICISLACIIFYITVFHGDLVNPYELIKPGF